MEKILVTGGAGYFGSLLIEKLLKKGYQVGCLDINKPEEFSSPVKFHRCDVRDLDGLKKNLNGYDVIYHNVAQVPLAKNKKLFEEVNIRGTENVCIATLENKCKKLIYTSSSAVFGIPLRNPVNENTLPKPGESYGDAKYKGEMICESFSKKGLNVTIIRPRTIIGHGRLGIFSILFDWINKGVDIPVLDDGKNLYQFIHADDLAEACILSSFKRDETYDIYNIGSDDVQSMRKTLEDLIKYSNTKSKVYSLPKKLIENTIKIFSSLRFIPLGDYHSLMYGESLYFDISKAKSELNFKPKFNTQKMFQESYDWFVVNNKNINNNAKSHHKSKVKESLLVLVKFFSVLRSIFMK